MGIRHNSLFKCPFLNLLFLLFASVIIPRALNLIKVGDQANVAWMYANGIEARLPNPYDASFAAALVYVVIWYGILRMLTYLKWTVKL